jgi:hypothetical protein
MKFNNSYFSLSLDDQKKKEQEWYQLAESLLLQERKLDEAIHYLKLAAFTFNHHFQAQVSFLYFISSGSLWFLS